jgi:DNA-binding winged helix-turn-helix (wHTH) protein/TolB-like protein/lipopolysaccharide biosynthesis regulator YciM
MSKGFGQVYQFGSFQLDVEQSLLSRDGESVALPPKIFDILVVLVENNGQLLDKEELMRRVWPDTFVEENNLTVNMSALRKALGDGANGLKYIETVPRRGYRFVADVCELMDAEASLLLTKQTVSSITIEEEEDVVIAATAGEPARQPVLELSAATSVTLAETRRPWRTVFLLAALAVVIVSIVVAVWLASKPKPIQTISDVRSLAVLPFKSLGAPNNDEALELGLTDALITKLSNLNPVIVRPTSAILKYANSTEKLSAIGQELGVEALLEGRVQRAGDRIRITVQLVQTENESPVWAESFDEQFTNIFAVQTTISERVSRALALQLTREQRQQLVKNYTQNTEAFQEYIRGRYYWNKQSLEEMRKAIAHFQRAIDIDPAYALAYAGIADCYLALSTPQIFLGASWERDNFNKAKAAARKALELDDTLAEAHTSLGATLARDDDEAAHREWDRAIELNPNYATVYSFYTIDLIGDGRPEEALEKIKRALEIDPLSVAFNTNHGMVLYRLRRYDEAIEQLRLAIEMNPNSTRAHWGLGLSYEQKGMYKEAISEFERCISFSNGGPLALAALAHVYAVSGQHGEAQKILAQLLDLFRQGRASAYYVAAVYAGLGDKEKALALLEQHKESLTLGLLKVDVYFDPLRDEPRFIKLLQRK